jgi:hypothetical protein
MKKQDGIWLEPLLDGHEIGDKTDMDLFVTVRGKHVKAPIQSLKALPLHHLWFLLSCTLIAKRLNHMPTCMSQSVMPANCQNDCIHQHK